MMPRLYGLGRLWYARATKLPRLRRSGLSFRCRLRDFTPQQASVRSSGNQAEYHVREEHANLASAPGRKRPGNHPQVYKIQDQSDDPAGQNCAALREVGSARGNNQPIYLGYQQVDQAKHRKRHHQACRQRPAHNNRGEKGNPRPGTSPRRQKQQNPRDQTCTKGRHPLELNMPLGLHYFVLIKMPDHVITV